MGVPLGKLLGLASGLGAGTALGYGLSRKHDFSIVKAQTPAGPVVLTGQRGDLKKLKDAAKSGDTKTFSELAGRVFVLGQGPQMGSSAAYGRGMGVGPRDGTGPRNRAGFGPAYPSKRASLAKLAGILGASAEKSKRGLLEILKAHPGKLGLGAGVLGTGLGAGVGYGVMRGREFAAMDLPTPVGPIPIAGQRRRLNEIVSAAKSGNPEKFRKAMSRVVPLHPNMAPIIQAQSEAANRPKTSALNAYFYNRFGSMAKTAGIFGSLGSGLKWGLGITGLGLAGGLYGLGKGMGSAAVKPPGVSHLQYIPNQTGI